MNALSDGLLKVEAEGGNDKGRDLPLSNAVRFHQSIPRITAAAIRCRRKILNN
jgi:hypothetical protein